MKNRYQQKDPVVILLFIILVVFVIAIILIHDKIHLKNRLVDKTGCINYLNLSYEIL